MTHNDDAASRIQNKNLDARKKKQFCALWSQIKILRLQKGRNEKGTTQQKI